jgi:hypothetical protein
MGRSGIAIASTYSEDPCVSLGMMVTLCYSPGLQEEIKRPGRNSILLGNWVNRTARGVGSSPTSSRWPPG